MGIETEYGIAGRGAERDPAAMSRLFLSCCRAAVSPGTIWDYSGETPWRDARGFQVEEEMAEIPAAEDNRLLNKILGNGGRLYIDAGHPEYASPECTSARDLVKYERAGDRMLALTLEWAAEELPPETVFTLYKNNSDGKGNSYGCHENYLVSRDVPLSRLSEWLAPFLVTRQIFAGAGKVGCEDGQPDVFYQISQRADFFESLIGLHTMKNRPIMNTRDEPHANPERYRRVHVIVGDSNLCEAASYLKVAATSIVLDMIEHDWLPGRISVSLEDPVAALRQISRDLTCRTELRQEDGKRRTAVHIQREYLLAAWDYYDRYGLDMETKEALRRWGGVLDKLEQEPDMLHRELDWVAKKRLLESLMARWGVDWRHSKIVMADLQYHDIRPEKGLYFALERRGFVDRLLSEDEIQTAVVKAPEDTRAYFRAECLRRFPERIYGASWSSLLFHTGHDTVLKVPLMEPSRGTRELTGELFQRCETADELLDALRA
jgi:proteasome accessory factor A